MRNKTPTLEEISELIDKKLDEKLEASEKRTQETIKDTEKRLMEDTKDSEKRTQEKFIHLEKIIKTEVRHLSDEIGDFFHETINPQLDEKAEKVEVNKRLDKHEQRLQALESAS